MTSGCNGIIIYAINGCSIVNESCHLIYIMWTREDNLSHPKLTDKTFPASTPNTQTITPHK